MTKLEIMQIETAKQNQKIPFHSLGRFAAEGWGEETREKCKEIFWFLHTLSLERVRGALSRFTTLSERTIQSRATTRSARAISRQNPADFVHTRFELRPKNTANFHFRPKRWKAECREATQNAIFALRAKVFSGQEKACGRGGVGSFEQSSKQNKSFATNLFVRPIGRYTAIFHFDCPKVYFSI
jgi:hypothetical protein